MSRAQLHKALDYLTLDRTGQGDRRRLEYTPYSSSVERSPVSVFSSLALR
jgi:hypothetical protein